MCSGQWVWQKGTPHCEQRAGLLRRLLRREFAVDLVEVAAPLLGAPLVRHVARNLDEFQHALLSHTDLPTPFHVLNAVRALIGDLRAK